MGVLQTDKRERHKEELGARCWGMLRDGVRELGRSKVRKDL